ncbi:hypothetical protein [Janthinobacterium sp. MDB2-8]|uniref:hypothetical protein n=1 Tax=Janthinobacterium sp. MDB2-8 TaxID=1259338 RepID=UPI003F28F707
MFNHTHKGGKLTQPLFRALGMLALMALGASSEERHPFERHLALLRPVTLAALPDMV